jgi:hypothetical protein
LLLLALDCNFCWIKEVDAEDVGVVGLPPCLETLFFWVLGVWTEKYRKMSEP